MTKQSKNTHNSKNVMPELSHNLCGLTIYRLRQELNAEQQKTAILEEKLQKKDRKTEAFSAIRSAKKRTTISTPTQIDKLNKYMSNRGKNELIILHAFFASIEKIFLDANAINMRMLMDWCSYELNTRI